MAVTEKIVNKFGVYDEGAISYLRVRRLSDGEIVLRRTYKGRRMQLDQRLRARHYKLISFVRPCDGDCGDLEPATDRCSAEFRLRPGRKVAARIVTNDGSACRIKLTDVR